MVTHVYQQEPASVTSFSHNKRAQVSEDLVITAAFSWTPGEARNRWRCGVTQEKMLLVLDQGSSALIKNNRIIATLALLPNYGWTQASFWKVYVWLRHAAGFFFFTDCFANPFFHTAIKCNFSYRDKNVYQNKSTAHIARKWKHESEITQNEPAFFFPVISRGLESGNKHETKKMFSCSLLVLCNAWFCLFTYRTIVLHEAFPLHLHLLQITWLLLYFQSRPRWN